VFGTGPCRRASNARRAVAVLQRAVTRRPRSHSSPDLGPDLAPGNSARRACSFSSGRARRSRGQREGLQTVRRVPGSTDRVPGRYGAGVALAHERLQSTPDDDTARFFLGKLNLNYVWLQLGPLGRKTGWDQYWPGDPGRGPRSESQSRPRPRKRAWLTTSSTRKCRSARSGCSAAATGNGRW
jgi:hypothetical protein